MVTRGALARANKLAQNRNDDGSDSDDEAPEVVSKVSAKEQAEEQLRQEKEAAKARAAAAKRSNKRKAPVAEVTKEDKQDEDEAAAEEEETVEAPELPADVLSAIATRHEEERTEQELDEALEKKNRERAAAAKKRTHIRDFGTVQVQTLDALETVQGRKLTDSAVAFLDRKAAPHRARMNVLDGHPSQFTKKQRRRV